MTNIINPVNKETVNINSEKGQFILKKYVNLILLNGGKDKKKIEKIDKKYNLNSIKKIKSITIYGLDYCEYCMKAKKLVKALKKKRPFRNIKFEYTKFKKEDDPKPSYKYIPKILVNLKFIGGYDNLKRLIKKIYKRYKKKK